MTILQSLEQKGQFTVFLKLIKAADLTSAFDCPGPITVFAPTDDVCAKMPVGTLENLMKPENKPMLQQMLLYHVARGNYTTKELVKMKSVPTVQGTCLTITQKKDGCAKVVMVNCTKITCADICTKNGTIQVIDGPLMPVQSMQPMITPIMPMVPVK